MAKETRRRKLTRRNKTRRQEYAEATRQAILDAARRLFCKKGFFSTKVNEIAALARVSPATVYAVAGGKQGLLHTLMDTSTTAPMVADTIDRINTMDDAKGVIAFLAQRTRQMREEFGDIMRLILKTAPHDKAASETLATATARYRQAFVPIAAHLSDLGALRDGMTLTRAVDILWFYFGYHALFTLGTKNYEVTECFA
jgi:AcrR family transcriptional regulator